ncbi:L-amino acid N-acyltransferase YncA [Ekhidna lutea]|uniref:L-amino acid N-acyltransferase YncA n=1 Tax=Ekhidna lutea TaxID=447679 RepID=A0A239JL22_EKHLU|nr:GNAT family N-acetyltransferase [Ekhidna lutea]SNT06272.1 L-amino acid N-acyltransferase YncA [Ekhidna lutea]
MIRKGEIDEILPIIEGIPEFKSPYSKEEFTKRLSATKSVVLIAEDDGKPVGFKCGYQRNSNASFYSWMGGVLPEFRGMGIAAALLKEMELWCRSKGYRYLTFKTLNEHKSMLIFALKYGFEIIDTERSSKDERIRIWLRKQLK